MNKTGNCKYIAIDNDLMNESIKKEICHLLHIQADINVFNEVKKKFTDVVPLSQAKYDELLHNGDLDNDTIYCIFNKETGQYIDGYKDI